MPGPYLSPGVYVEEVPPAASPIAGVGTSTAGFIGVIPDVLYKREAVKNEILGKGDGSKKEFDLKRYPVIIDSNKFTVKVNGTETTATLENDTQSKKSKLKLTTTASEKDKLITIDYIWTNTFEEKVSEDINTGTEGAKEFDLKNYPVVTGEITVTIDNSKVKATLLNKDQERKSTIEFKTAPQANKTIKVEYTWIKDKLTPVAAGERKLCTSFNQFVNYFGDFSFSDKDDGSSSPDPKNRYLHHAVYGFFNNGGTVCHVIRRPTEVALKQNIQTDLKELAKIDEIAIVGVPGIADSSVQGAVLDHCEQLEDRFAILDGKETVTEYTKDEIQNATRDSTYGAIYFPWIVVSDRKIIDTDPDKNNKLTVPPSGHIAGVYARVDNQRGVYKAPANEGIRGALDLKDRLTKNDQENLNPKGINVIRMFNRNIKIWGARTMGGDDNGEFKYISTRRLFNFLRESIDEGTQFAVFEPNSPSLWQRIKRNVGDFLLGQWRDGALFGETPEKAFFVKCDEETNPSDVRERGEVITEIGVAIVKPAEFVIFRIQQRTGG